MNAPIPFRKANRQRRTPIERLNAIMPTLVWDAHKALGKNPVALTPSGQVIETLDDYMEILVAAQMHVSARSLYRWRDAFLTSGGNLDALRDRPRSDKGTSHAFQGRALAVAIICGLHDQGRTVRAIYAALAEVWPDLYPGSRVPHYRTVRAFIRSTFEYTVPLRAPKVRP